MDHLKALSQKISMKKQKTAILCYEISSALGEGAFWDHRQQKLYWVDIESGKVNIYDPRLELNRSIDLPSRVGTVVPKNESEMVVALEDGIYMLNTDTSALILMSDVEANKTKNRFNDGKCDPYGNLWVGSMHLKLTESSGSLYKLEPNGQTTIMLDNVRISNGIAWTADQRTMYFIDTPTEQIQAFDFDPEKCTISNQRTAVDIDPSIGFGDGMTIDAEDKLWVALWNGKGVARFDPLSGVLMEFIEVPALHVTSCAFGGEELDTLFITTSSLEMSADEHKKYPLAGSLFKVKPGVKGMEGNYFSQIK